MKYQTDLFFNENGEPEGIMVEHMKILSEYFGYIVPVCPIDGDLSWFE